ncbi:PilN domain-containing protein [Patescibacteria group bacterium]|nr:PilN domain-containing protein [Patescibacteria group bacterium]
MAALLNLNFELAGKRKEGINFLPTEEFAASAKGRILSWLLTSFRYIVIVTEIIVMTAFLSRFWLDARVADLNETIDQRKALIGSYSEFENEFRSVQKKVGIILGISSEQPPSDVISTLTGFLPEGVSLSSISQTGNEIRLQARTTSEISISQFVSNLTNTNKFEEVILTQLDSADNSGFLIFDLTLKLKKGN